MSHNDRIGRLIDNGNLHAESAHTKKMVAGLHTPVKLCMQLSSLHHCKVYAQHYQDAMTVLLYIQFYDAFNNGWVHCHHAERLG